MAPTAAQSSERTKVAKKKTNGASRAFRGYRRHVRKSIEEDAPDVARTIVEHFNQRANVDRPTRNDRRRRFHSPAYQAGRPAWEPITLYRGISKTRFDPTHYARKYGGDIYFSSEAHALSFATGRDR
jgi:hypothetical protein